MDNGALQVQHDWPKVPSITAKKLVLCGMKHERMWLRGFKTLLDHWEVRTNSACGFQNDCELVIFYYSWRTHHLVSFRAQVGVSRQGSNNTALSDQIANDLHWYYETMLDNLLEQTNCVTTYIDASVVRTSLRNTGSHQFWWSYNRSVNKLTGESSGRMQNYESRLIQSECIHITSVTIQN